MKKYNFIVVLSMVAVLLSGCATHFREIQPSFEEINIPSLNQVQQSELGDTLVSKGTLYTYDGMVLLNEVYSKSKNTFLHGPVATIPPSDLILKYEDSAWWYFYARDLFMAGVSANVTCGLRKSKKNKPMELFVLIGFQPWSKGLVEPEPKYELKKVRAVDKRSFQQELIYNGKAGSNVKFMYREMSNDVMRPAFSQEMQYDLNESKTIGFKGARIEIIEATNTTLKYKVLKSFPDA